MTNNINGTSDTIITVNYITLYQSSGQLDLLLTTLLVHIRILIVPGHHVLDKGCLSPPIFHESTVLTAPSDESS